MAGDILIVEDEAAIADAITFALRAEGFTPHWCTLGEEALVRIRRGAFRLAILDVGLPDISGFETCRRLRQFSELPVIFLTARNEEVDRIVGLELGADDYLAKPFSPRELVARVRVVLRREARGAGAGEGFLVDEGRRQIRFRGQLLDLTRYEYELLRTLLARPGLIHTRGQLLETVWSGAEESGDRTVDTHVKTLRAKLRSVDPEWDPIQTHRGQGYSVGKRG